MWHEHRASGASCETNRRRGLFCRCVVQIEFRACSRCNPWAFFGRYSSLFSGTAVSRDSVPASATPPVHMVGWLRLVLFFCPFLTDCAGEATNPRSYMTLHGTRLAQLDFFGCC